ncbi:MAG: leucine-rich repeat domain-containing protein [Oscillospiraceae bacterium]|nr:leucine-rich repeat domain-containing protein [Oscillospiraceae bacterium]
MKLAQRFISAMLAVVLILPLFPAHGIVFASAKTLSAKILPAKTQTVRRVTLNRNSVTLEAGKTAKLNAKTAPANQRKNVKWRSSNKSVVTVANNGRIRAIKAGRATVTASVGNRRAICRVTVRPIPKFTVTFRSLGAVLARRSVERGKNAKAPAKPVRAGYIFDGWDRNFKNVRKNLVVNAKWKMVPIPRPTPKPIPKPENPDTLPILSYTVTFMDGEDVIARQTVEHGKAAVSPEALEIPEKEGLVFDGWDKTFDNITADLTVSAIWKARTYTVTFVDGEDVIAEQTIEHGKAAVSPEAIEIPEKEGLVFDGWDKAFDNITADLTVSAIWKARTYTVTFVDGEDVIAEQTVEHGKSAVSPEALEIPEKEGLVFDGWDKTFDNITADLTVSAIWKARTYTVTFMDGEDVIARQTVEHGQAAVAPQNPVKTGHNFNGWDKTFDNITADLTVSATWMIKTYTVKFMDGDDRLSEQIIEHGQSAVSPKNPVKTGHIFDGWDKAFDNITADLTVTATWRIKTYTVKFMDGEYLISTQTVEHGKTVGSLADPVKLGCDFIGWFDQNEHEFTAETIITADIDVQSSWTKAVLLTIKDVFPDPNFAWSIAGVLKKTVDDTIAQSDLDKTTSLKASSVKDIDGVQYLRNLSELNLSSDYLINNKISDISPLARLINLEVLELFSNEISDISPLAGLINLKNLGLGANRIIDISPLTGLVNAKLERLSLAYNQIADISPLAELVNLSKVLYLDGNQISDLSPLAGLTNLTLLGLNSNQISDISSLAELVNLKGLELNNNQINDIRILAELVNLVWLHLDNNQINDISPLAELINLEVLNLGGNKISNISSLAKLESTYWTVSYQLIELPFGESIDIIGIDGSILTLDADGRWSVFHPLYSQMISFSGQVTFADSPEPKFHTVKFMDGEYLIGTQTVEHGKTVGSLADPVKLGCGFIGWFDQNEHEFTAETIITADIDVQSSWTKAVLLTIKDVFPDPNLAKAIAGVLKKTVDDTITQSDLDKITSLRPTSVKDIDGLQYLRNLSKLYLSYNKISDISPLARLINLEVLELIACQMNDISPLAELISLEKLDLGGNQISDISSLEKLVNLKYLQLSANEISDLNPLAGLVELKELYIAYNNQINDISPLAGLVKLECLSLIFNKQISDISPLAGLVELKELELADNQISDISPLAGLVNLTKLELFQNQISDISPLAGLVNLKRLSLEYNRISDMSPLAVLNSFGIVSNQLIELPFGASVDIIGIDGSILTLDADGRWSGFHPLDNQIIIFSGQVTFADSPEPRFHTVKFMPRKGDAELYGVPNVGTAEVKHGSLLEDLFPEETMNDNKNWYSWNGMHIFKGWYKDSLYTEPWNFETDTVTNDITLYSKWSINPDNVNFSSYKGEIYVMFKEPYYGDIAELFPELNIWGVVDMNKRDYFYYKESDPDSAGYIEYYKERIGTEYSTILAEETLESIMNAYDIIYIHPLVFYTGPPPYIYGPTALTYKEFIILNSEFLEFLVGITVYGSL